MRRLAAVLVPLALVLAGCTAPGSGPGEVELVDNGVPDQSRGDDEVWVVWVHGRERRDPPSNIACSIVFDHDLDRDARTVTYDGERYGFDPNRTSVLLAYDVFGPGSGCPAAYELVPDPDGPIRRDVAHLGNLSVDVAGDGSLTVQDRDVPLGTAARITWNVTEDGDRYEGSLRVETLGAWPRSNLEAR